MIWTILVVLIFVTFFMSLSSNSKNSIALSGQCGEDRNWKKWQSIKMQEVQNQPIYDKFIKIYQSCEPLYENSVFTRDEVKDLVGQMLNISNEDDKDYILAISHELSQSRTPNDYAPSTGIQLRPNEKCFFKTKNCILNTIQKLYKNVSYSGLRYNVGAYRMGNLTLNSKDVEGFRPFGGGCCYVTNQRVIINAFDNKNRVIPLREILSFATYEENAVLLNIENSRPVIINFPCNGMFNITQRGGAIIFNDDKMHFLYALDEVLERRRNSN